jgi:hypothetical protein
MLSDGKGLVLDPVDGELSGTWNQEKRAQPERSGGNEAALD